MNEENWPAFIAGFVLGILVAGGVLGTFGWQKYQATRAEAEEQARLAREAEMKCRQEAERAAQWAERAAENERKARQKAKKALEAAAALNDSLNRLKLKAGQPGDKKDK